jgi:hypothetical protein
MADRPPARTASSIFYTDRLQEMHLLYPRIPWRYWPFPIPHAYTLKTAKGWNRWIAQLKFKQQVRPYGLVNQGKWKFRWNTEAEI